MGENRYARLAGVAGPLLLLLISIGFYWRLALTDQYTWIDHPDVACIEIPRLGFVAREVHAGRFPLWDPHLWSGQPLIGQTQPGPLYPLNLLLYLLPLQDGYLNLLYLNWYFVAVHFLAALFCYWLARDLGRSRAASILAGCAFAFGGFLGTVPWLDRMNGAVWTPLVFLFLLRAVRGERRAANAALAGLFSGISWLAGHHDLPMLVSVAAMATWLYYALRRGRPDWRLLGAAALFLVVAGLTSAAQTWPTYDARRAHRWVGAEAPVTWKDRVPYDIHTHFSLPARGLLELIIPRTDPWGEEKGPFLNPHSDTSAFLGAGAVAMAALGLALRWREPPVRWAAALAAGAAVYSLGALSPLHGILYSVTPLLGSSRHPVRALHLLHLAIAVAAAYGIDGLLAEPRSRWPRRLAPVLAGFAALVLGTETYLAIARRPDLNDRMVLAGFTSLALAGLLAAWERAAARPRLAAAAILGLALLELSNLRPGGLASRFDKNRNQYVNALRGDRDIAAFLRRQPGPVRIAFHDQSVPVNLGDWHGIDMLQGYMAGLSSNLVRHEMHTRRTQELFGVTHAVGRKPDRPDQHWIFEGSSGLNVYRNPDALPRAWVVHEGVGAKSVRELQGWIQDPAFDLRRKAILLGEAPSLPGCAEQGDVQITRHTSDRIQLSARMPCAGMVVVSETFFPGWTAKVDGREAPVYEAYGALRGVVMEAGTHAMELDYRPLSVYGGAALTGLGVLLAALLVWVGTLRGDYARH